MELPLVSIGLPAYNRPQGLKDAIECVLAQTHPNWELHISDNASPNPEVEDIGRRYAAQDSRIHYHRQGENIGMSPNLKAVYDLANKGEYFLWLADDDLILPDFICYCLQKFRENPRAALVFPAEGFTNTAGKVIESEVMFTRFNGTSQHDILERYLWEPEVWGKAHMYYGLYRRKDLDDVMTTWVHWQHDLWGGDFVFMYALLARYPAVMGNGPVLFLKNFRMDEDVRYIPVPPYQTMPVREWHGYLKRHLAAAVTAKQKRQLWRIMTLRLLHKIFIALPQKIVYRLTGWRLSFGRDWTSPNRPEVQV